MKTKKKRGQVGTLDFIIGFVLFIIVIATAVKIMVNIPSSETYDNLYRDTIYISGSLMTQGHPLDWNATTVIVPGITENNRVNESKLWEFGILNYEHSKRLFHTTNEYIFFFKNSTNVVNITKCVYGYPIATKNQCEPNLESIDYSDLVKIERLVIYNSSLVTLNIYSWR